ncbi:hypothetical protein BU23DRAFT_549325 [Bimuria novae-zelandiae CBS 107.79]|uniref:DUF567-domain-containing protein n=1 Tax=Bimuria novae-zelandiae CBS 107.79 TaxID=1447943 RepID=A0A6A5VR92_9PLEO|nr:hypothetical protein BU23DRAFT_549325 [Bimuria novae-zelandiae CBS 107.79]
MSGYSAPQGGWDHGQAGAGYQQQQPGYGQTQHALHNQSPGIGIFNSPVYGSVHGGVTIVLKEHVLSLTGDSFSIKRDDGTPILQVEGKLVSIHGRKKVSDMAGNHLFDIVKEHFHIHATFAIEDPQGNKLMEVQSNFKLMGSSAVATFPMNAPENEQHKLKMKGSFFDTSAEIIDEKRGGAVAARINRKILSGKDLFFGQQTYSVQISPGYDQALIAAMCICLDEKNNEGK